MRIVFFLACWKRPEITELCFMGLNRLMEYDPKRFQCSAFAVISEPEMVPLCKRYGIDYLEYENKPVGMKKNAGLQEVLKKDFDYLIELGSDDLILNELLDCYEPAMKEGRDFIGSRDLLMIDSIDGNCRTLNFDGETAQGLGRCLSKRLLQCFTGNVHVKAHTNIIDDDSVINPGETGFLDIKTVKAYEPMGWCERTGKDVTVHLWDDINQGLDNNSAGRIMRKGFKFHAVETPEPLMADVKGDDNIWGFNPEIGEKVDVQTFLSKLSQKERSKFFENMKVLKAKRVECAQA